MAVPLLLQELPLSFHFMVQFRVAPWKNELTKLTNVDKNCIAFLWRSKISVELPSLEEAI